MNPDRESVRARVLATASAAALVAAAAACPALAQEGGGAERIVVTGSRITRTSGFTTPTPVTVVDSAELDNMDPGNVILSLSQLPVFYGNQTPDTTGFPSSAGSNVNLRGAGATRTLTLLDGRRVVPSNRLSTTDVGIFPEALIRSVETVTGGASASYGSDAVAGVVNFILDTDFVGLKAHAQHGVTSRGDGQNYEAGLAWGAEVGERGHLLLSADVFHQDAISSFESLKKRPYYRQVARVTGPADGPNFVIRPYASPTDFSNAGIITSMMINPADPLGPLIPSPIHRLEFNGDGTTTPLAFSGVGQLTGGCNCQAEPFQSYGVDADDEVLPLSERGSAFVYFDYELTPNVEVYVQGLYGNSRTDQRREGITLLSLWAPQIYSGNPFLPANVQQIMTENNLQSFTLGFLGLEDPNSPIGDNRTDQKNDTYSGTIGFNADLGNFGFLSNWNARGYVQYGENKQDQQFHNGIRVDRVPLALDAVVDPATGSVVCRAALLNPTNFGDCVPMNIFGGVENISDAAAAYIIDDDKHNISETTQTFVELVLDGELFEGWAGPISMAIGASYREDTFKQGVQDPTDEFVFINGVNTGTRGLLDSNDPTSPWFGIRPTIPAVPGVSPSVPGTVPAGYRGDSNSSTVQFTSARTFEGSFTVEEAFTEIEVPLLAGLPLVQQLTTNLAARYANYSGSGGVWAYKGGLDWSLNDAVRVRGTYSRDTRAATLAERWDQTRGGANVTDPVLGNIVYSTASFSGGNENVNPELADTYTAGVVLRPGGAFEGLQTSVDWYSISISDAIGTVGVQNLVSGCFQGITEYCQYVIRDPVTNRIDRVENIFINIDEQKISGVDFEASYARDVSLFGGDERLAVRLLASWLEENSLTSGVTGIVDDRAGEVGSAVLPLPEYKATAYLNYSRGPLSVFLQERYISDGVLDRTLVESSGRILGRTTIDDNDVDAVFYTDAGVSYDIESDNGTWTVFANVNNLLDQDPPYAPGIVGRTGTTEFNPALHDTVGRRWVFGVRASF